MASSTKMPPAKVPNFRRMSFYLDLKDYAHTTSLTSDIRTLGGTVETFLSRDVKYVVTNRSSLKQSDKNSSSSLSSRSFSPAALSFHSSSSNQDSSTRFRQTTALNSRAGMLLERARQVNAMTSGSRDVLQLAREWGSKIVHVSVLTDWIQKLKSKHPASTTDNKERKLVSENQRLKLVTPFIKYEDDDQLYSPQYRQMEAWPALRTDDVYLSGSGGSGATAGRDDTPFVSGANSSSKRFPSKHSKKEVPVSVRENHHFSKPKKGPAKTAGHKPGFCEMCAVSYINIYEHVNTGDHKNFVADESNFATLDAAIFDLPNFEDYRRRLVSESKNSEQKSQTPNRQTPSIDNKKQHSKTSTDTLKRIKRKLCLQEFNFVQPPSKKITPSSMMTMTDDVAQPRQFLSGDRGRRLRLPFRELSNSVNCKPTNSPPQKLLTPKGGENTSPTTSRVLRSTAIKRRTSTSSSSSSSQLHLQNSPTFFVPSSSSAALSLLTKPLDFHNSVPHPVPSVTSAPLRAQEFRAGDARMHHELTVPDIMQNLIVSSSAADIIKEEEQTWNVESVTEEFQEMSTNNEVLTTNQLTDCLLSAARDQHQPSEKATAGSGDEDIESPYRSTGESEESIIAKVLLKRLATDEFNDQWSCEVIGAEFA